VLTFRSTTNERRKPKVARWDPFQEIEALRREVERAFEEVGIGSETFPRVAFLPGRGPRRYPLVNLHEDRDHVYVEALAPGIDPNALHLTVVRNTLTISGEKRHTPGEVRPEAFHRSERAAGRFVRTIELPVEVDENNVRAEYRNGLLLVTLPKAEKAKPRQIHVAVS
jgi:HSP20 family protein